MLASDCWLHSLSHISFFFLSFWLLPPGTRTITFSIQSLSCFCLQLIRYSPHYVDVNNEFLFLKSDYKIKRINFNDILYIEGLKDYVKVFIHNSLKPILSLTSLKLLESKLPENKFMRVHRSFIVNLEKIDTIERSRIVFGKEYIPVSDQYKEKFQEFLDKNFL